MRENTEPSTDQDADVDIISQASTMPLSNKGGAKRASEPPVPWVLLIQAPD